METKIINANTKIAHLLKANTDALEAIISIDSKFNKLRNPLLRKVLAGRTSIAMASKIAGCHVNDFFDKLKPLGFEVEAASVSVSKDKRPLPSFLSSLSKSQINDLDVRELLTSGKDPLNLILKKIRSIQPSEVLKVINSFEPVPLIKMMEKQGFDIYADVISDDLVETYFYKRSNITIDVKPKEDAETGWSEIMQRFNDNLVPIDVRKLEMPQPMITILAELDKLPSNKALFVYHKRIPVFLLPELSDRKFDYRIKEISEGNVNLLIYKN